MEPGTSTVGALHCQSTLLPFTEPGRSEHMSKKVEPSDKGKVKFRYIEFDVEGGNAAIQDGLRHIAAALTRSGPPPKALPGADTPGRGATEAPPGQLSLIPETTDDSSEIDVTPASASGESKPRQPRKTPAFTVLNGLDLDAGDGYPSLQDFALQKGADNHNHRYLVSAVWLKRNKSIKDFTANHAFTIYKVLGWGSAPTDAGAPLRELKKQSLVVNGEKPGAYLVNDAGEAKVERMPGA